MSQGLNKQDLNKLVKIWARCTNSDTDLCSRMSDEPRFQYQNLANMVDLLIADDSSSLVEDFVIIRQVHGSIQRSCLDQIITNCPSKMTWPEILGMTPTLAFASDFLVLGSLYNSRQSQNLF